MDFFYFRVGVAALAGCAWFIFDSAGNFWLFFGIVGFWGGTGIWYFLKGKGESTCFGYNWWDVVNDYVSCVLFREYCYGDTIFELIMILYR